MKKLLGPLLAASLTTPACLSGGMDLNIPEPRGFRNIPAPRGSECETRDCYIKTVFGADKEGLTKYGAFITCETGPVDLGQLVKETRMRYFQAHGCQNSDPNQKLFAETTASRELNVKKNTEQPFNFKITCVSVNDDDGSGTFCKKK